MVVVLDIDGTLANNDHRSHHVDCDNPNWDAFLAPDLVGKDIPFSGAIRAIKHFQALKYKLIFLTGRNEALRDTTMRWLLEHFELDVQESELYMRPLGNMLKPSEYKREQVLAIKQDYGSDLVFIDDDKYLHAVYAEFGIALHAPECWVTMFPDHGELETETHWRK